MNRRPSRVGRGRSAALLVGAAALAAVFAACGPTKTAAPTTPRSDAPAKEQSADRGLSSGRDAASPYPAGSGTVQRPAARQAMSAPEGSDTMREGDALVMQKRMPAPLGAAQAAHHRSGKNSAAELPPSFAGEELWVIARAPAASESGADRNYPELRAKLPDQPQEVPLPLKHTEVKARIAGYIASVNVRQQYENPYAAKIEAVYVFPLPQDAAVNEFVMTVGARRIRGIIREREEAEKLYDEAKRQGYVASLLTQERPNVFTQSVANIEPGQAIDVDLTYFNTLAHNDGEYEFVFPMVVGPRFNPPGTAQGIGAVARGRRGTSGQATEVQYLDPDTERSGHDIALRVDVDAGMEIESLSSPSHAIDTTRVSADATRVELSRLDRMPNKDFVLRYRLAGATVKTAFLNHRDERGGFFTLMLQPPASLAAQKRAPMEMIFVLDCSGSMGGTPIEIAKAATERALRKLGPDDTFQIIQFSLAASQLGPDPVPATPENVRRGIQYLHGLQGEGGTMMIEGIKTALDFPHDRRRLRVVSFMTDGYIGNEAEILGAIHDRLGDARIFSFGLGSSTNRFLLERMAQMGRGAVAFVGIDESFAPAIDQFYERISHPALTDVGIDWGALEVTDVYPERIPDLFVGRPVMITGRLRNDPGKATIRVRGMAGEERQELEVAADTSDEKHPAIAAIWARARIADLENDATWNGSPSLAGEIKQVALAYNLMSAYTAFVAVDSSQRTAGNQGTTVVQPVPVPDGVAYDTTVQ